MKDLFLLLRPKQWAKNLLVFAAFIFTGRLSTGEGAGAASIAFAAMCLASSGTYVFNDLKDRERDRLHPKKRLRPLAAGRIGVAAASAIGAGCLLSGLALAFGLNRASGAVIAIYLLLQIAYNLGLKKTPVADVFVIATGFVLRAVLSATAIGAKVSVWLLLCTACLALMLGFAKRRSEWVSQGADRAKSRESLEGYSLSSLDAFVQIFAGASILSYLLYSIDSATGRAHPFLLFTAPFVTYGIARYLLIVFREGEGGEPADVLFGDVHVIFAVLGFLVTAALSFVITTVPLLER